jgi:hypothetical protein
MSSENKLTLSNKDTIESQNDIHPGHCTAGIKCPWAFIMDILRLPLCGECGYIGFRVKDSNKQIYHLSRFKYIGLSRNKKNTVIGFAATGNKRKEDLIMVAIGTEVLETVTDSIKIALGFEFPPRGPTSAELDDCDACMLAIGMDIK